MTLASVAAAIAANRKSHSPSLARPVPVAPAKTTAPVSPPMSTSDLTGSTATKPRASNAETARAHHTVRADACEARASGEVGAGPDAAGEAESVRVAHSAGGSGDHSHDELRALHAKLEAVLELLHRLAHRWPARERERVAVATDHQCDPDRGLDAKQASELLGVCRSSFYELRKQPGFPEAVQVGKRSVRYRRGDLIAWRATRTSELPLPSLLPPDLLARRAAAASPDADQPHQQAPVDAGRSR
ncbi:MAG: helix-turn-helix domain-containing protein [Ideonella sp.]|nr:helix-turn-helix domain-containing protein [Ideonella sp.]